MNNKYYLRKADYSDLNLLYRWANDPVVRSNSFNTDIISYDNHVKWFNSVLEDNSVLQFIMMNDGTPVGQIRLSINGNEAEIGYSISKEHRGKGFGHRILQLAADLISEQYPDIHKLIAKVKPENTASNRLFQTEGYKMKYVCYEQEVRNGSR